MNDEILVRFAKCFSTTDGKKVLDYLMKMTIDRYLGPDATNEELRHLEGQRQLVFHILSLIKKGKTPQF